MADYLCIDGPLKGRRFQWRKPPRTGEPVTVALLDVDHAVLEVDYRVQPAADPAAEGRLEFVRARDAHGEAQGAVLRHVRRVGGAAGRVPARVARAVTRRPRHGSARPQHS